MERTLRNGDDELTIYYEMVRKFCIKCGTKMMHEHGNYIKDGKVVSSVWACIRCGRITQEKR